jgi:hypothetical protein
MATRKKQPPNRLRISQGIVNSCRSFTERDYHNALLWAAKVVQLAGSNHVLTEDEARYLNEVITKYGQNSDQ